MPPPDTDATREALPLTEASALLSGGAGHRVAFTLLFIVLMVVAAGNTALQAVMPAIGRELHLSDTLVAGIYSLSSLLWAGSAPFWATQSDRRGRKPLILFGLGGYALSMILYGVAVLAGLHNLLPLIVVFPLLLLARSLYGLTGSATNPSSQAYVADRTGVEGRTQALATLASAIGLGTVLGPAIAPFFALPPIGLSGPMFIFAALALGTLYAVWRKLPETPQEAATDSEVGEAAPSAERRPGLLTDPRVRMFLLYAFLIVSAQAAQTQALGFLVIDILRMPPRQAQTFIGAAMMAGAAAGLLAQWGLIRLLHMRPKDLMRWGAGAAVLGNVLTAFAPDYGSVVFAFALATLGFGFARPGFTAGASLAVGGHEQGKVAGVMTAVIGASFILAPVGAMALYEIWRPAPFLLNAVVAGGALLMALFSGSLSRAGERVEPRPQSTNLLRG